jgi:hypothetical protein
MAGPSIQTQPTPAYSPFEQTVLINDDGSNPIADAKRKVMIELGKDRCDKKDTGSEMLEVNRNESFSSTVQPQHLSQPAPDFSPFEKTILINNDGSNPIVDVKRKVMAELKGDVQSEKMTAESKGTLVSPSRSQSQSQPELFPIEKVNLNNPGLFEKTILLDENNGSPILEAKKKVLEELGRSQKTVERQKDEVGSEKVKERRENSLTSHSEISPFEKTVLFNDSGVNPITEIKKKVMQEMGKDSSQESGADSHKNKLVSKEKVDSSAQSQPQPSSQSKPNSKPVVSDKSQILSLKNLYIDDSMSTDYSIVDKSKETPQEDTDGEILPLIDESQSIDFSQNDKKVMSQSATVDMSRSSLGLTKTNISLKNITPSDPYSVHYGVYEKNAEEKNQLLPAGKTENEKLTARELVFKVISEFGPLNILQLKNHINEKLDKKDRINTLKLFALLRQVDLETHEKRVRYYRSC